MLHKSLQSCIRVKHMQCLFLPSVGDDVNEDVGPIVT